MTTKSFMCFFLFFYVILIAGIISLADAKLPTIFVEDVCSYDSFYTVNLIYKPSGILKTVPTKRGALAENFSCRIALVPKEGSFVVFSTYKYFIQPRDNLTVEDSDHHKIAFLGQAKFENEKKSIISEGKLTIDFQTSRYNSYSQFQFTFTQVNGYPCRDNEFQCENKKCLLKEYTCDGHNHCGDNSDQKNCVLKGGHESFISEKNDASGRISNSAVPWLIIIGICATLLFIIIIAFLIVFAKRTWQKKTAISAATSPNNASVNAIPHNVLLNVPVQPQQLSANNLPRTVNILQGLNPEPRPSVFDQIFKDIDSIINLLKRQKHSKFDKLSEVNDRKEIYQVPPMYPNLDQIPSAPELHGTVNPDFKIEE